MTRNIQDKINVNNLSCNETKVFVLDKRNKYKLKVFRIINGLTVHSLKNYMRKLEDCK